MSELHLRQQVLTYKGCESFTKHRQRIQKFREIDNLKQLYRNKVDKISFAYNAAFPDGKYLAKRTISDKTLKDITYKIPKNPEYN